MTANRCPWCGSDPLYTRYHDEEWGVPVFDDQTLFEFLVLESMQAGLSWITILRKREGFRKAFKNFNPNQIAKMSSAHVDQLVQNPDIIRHRGKIEATISNAKSFLQVQEEFDGFHNYVWSWTDGYALQNHFTSMKQVPSKTEISDRFSKDLKKRGFKFVGSTTVYAFMQATGMVNDHLVSCFRYKDLT